jgi:3'-phosphoadenosine 5'-phosphosulfate sulfotransferase (PAPS reductase)/FAD synthetase
MILQPDMFTPARALDEIAVDPMIVEAVRAGARVVFNLSGGKDCGAVSALTMLWLDSIGHPRELRLAIHADLGRAEWQSTPAQVEAQAAALGLPLTVVRANAGDLVARFENRWLLGLEAYADLLLYNLRGPWASPSLKFCQSEKKIQVMGPHLARTYRGETIINVVGIRREESTGRKHAPIAKLDTRFAKPGNRAGTTMVLWHPGVEMLVDEVFAANRRHGIPLAEGYGMGATRWSCAYCIMGSDNDLTVSTEAPGNHPLYHHYVGMEIYSGFSFQAGRWLGDVAPHLLSPAELEGLALAKIQADRRRELEAYMPGRHRYVDGWPLHLPTLEEAAIIAEVRREILGMHNLPVHYPTAQAVRDRFAELLEMKARKSK